jgi:hypothetical protein
MAESLSLTGREVVGGLRVGYAIISMSDCNDFIARKQQKGMKVRYLCFARGAKQH